MLILIFCAINARQSINRLGSSNITLAVVEAIGYFDFLTGLKKKLFVFIRLKINTDGKMPAFV